MDAEARVPERGQLSCLDNGTTVDIRLLGEEGGFDDLDTLHKNVNQYTKPGSVPIKAAARGETTIGIGCRAKPRSR